MNDDEAKRLEVLTKTAQSKYNSFVNNRKELIDELNEIADKADELKKDTEINTAMILGGLFFLPLLIAGIFTSIRAAERSSLWNKSREDEVKNMCEKDSEYFDDLRRSIEAVVEFIEELANVDGVNDAIVAVTGSSQSLRAEARAGTVVAKNMFRSGLAIVGINTRGINMRSFASSLDTHSNSEPSEFAAKLREMATSLKEELKKIQTDVERLKLETICEDVRHLLES